MTCMLLDKMEVSITERYLSLGHNLLQCNFSTPKNAHVKNYNS